MNIMQFEQKCVIGTLHFSVVEAHNDLCYEYRAKLVVKDAPSTHATIRVDKAQVQYHHEIFQHIRKELIQKLQRIAFSEVM